MARKMFFLCFSGSSPCNTAHWAKALLFILLLIHLTLKLCLPISLNLTDAQVIFYKMSVKEHCQIHTTRLSQIFFHLVKD